MNGDTLTPPANPLRFVRIGHTVVVGEAYVTRDAYRAVWYPKGWRSVDDPDFIGGDPAVPDYAIHASVVGLTSDGLSVIGDAEDVQEALELLDAAVETGASHPDAAAHNTMGLATDAEVATQIAALVAAAPSTLNTLDELAAALGDDPNLATTLTTLIGTKIAASLLDANTVLVADTDNIPVARTMGPGTVLARLASGGIVAATPDEILEVGTGMLPVEDGTTGATYTPTLTDRSSREHHFVEQDVTSAAVVFPDADTPGEWQFEVVCPDGTETLSFPSNVLALGDLNPTTPPGGIRSYSCYTKGDDYWRVTCAVSDDAVPTTWTPADLGTKLWFDLDPDTFGLADGTAINAVIGTNHLGATVITTSQPTVGKRPTLETNVLNGHAGILFAAANAHQLNLNADPVAVIGAAGMSVYAVLSRTATHGGTTGDNRGVFEFGEGAGWGGGTFDPGRTNYVHRLGTGQASNNVTTSYGDLGAVPYVAGVNKRVSDDTEVVRINRSTVLTATGKLDTLAGWTAGGSLGAGLFTANYFDGYLYRLIWTKSELTPAEMVQLENYAHSYYAIA